MNYYVGIDLGGTNTKIGILNIEGEIFKSTVIKTLSSEGAERTLTRIWEAAKGLAEDLKIKESSIKV